MRRSSFPFSPTAFLPLSPSICWSGVVGPASRWNGTQHSRAWHHCCRVSSKTGSRHDSLDYIYICAGSVSSVLVEMQGGAQPTSTETQASQARTAPTHRQTREVGRCRPTRQRNPRNAKNNVWRRFKRRDRKDRSTSLFTANPSRGLTS